MPSDPRESVIKLHTPSEGAAASVPEVMPADFLLVANFGPRGRTFKLFENLVGDTGVTVPRLAITLTPDEATAVARILQRAIRDVVAVVASGPRGDAA